MNKDIKYIKVRSRNATMIQLYGDKLKPHEWLISKRSNLLHMELQFSDRYGSISVSATKADGCDCVRFKMIGYTHAYRWSTIYIPVTAEQEARVFKDACRMANVRISMVASWAKNPDSSFRDSDNGIYYPNSNKCLYGPDAIKYDTAGVSLSFISKRRWWNPSNERQWCNETVGLLLMVVWPDIFEIKIGEGLGFFECKGSIPLDSSTFMGDWEMSCPTIPPQEQTPDQTAYLIEYYVDNLNKVKE